jgi:glycosyltransferase involved in cell wall biosynthesis
MVNVSCPTKFHSFQLSEQLERRDILHKFFTVYHQKKNPILSRFNNRRDNEIISINKIISFPLLALLYQYDSDSFRNNNLFDSFVKKHLASHPDYRVFIGWSGMSLKSMKQAKQDGKILILERGSSHIRNQFSLLTEEYKRWGLVFKDDERVAKQEEEEYLLADYITIPSNFVKQTFLDRNHEPRKLFKNNFGASALFTITKPKAKKFTILYLGTLNIRKGLVYLFQALTKLKINVNLFDVHFIGQIGGEVKSIIPQYLQSNWKFFGHVGHHELSDYISLCSVAVHPSIEEGLSMVIPQLMSCGVPVIATTNTGGADIITDGVDGYIVPIRAPEAIADKLSKLFEDHDLLISLQTKARERAVQFGSWDSYGDRYADFILSKLGE